MTQGAHDAGGGFGQSAGGNVARGAMVIVAALLVGFVLLQQGLSGSGGDDTAASTTNSTAATEGSSETTSIDNPEVSVPVETPAPTLGALRPAGEVAVLVLNATDGPVAGIAGKGSDKLKTNNYVTRDAKNATASGPSAVYYAEGFEAEARVVAEVLGASPDAVVSALDPATVPIADTQAANIVVVVGNDGVIVV